MKKLIVALLLIPFFSFVTAEWVNLKLDERASVNFPTTPEKKDMQGNPMWVQDIDKGARCMAMVVDFANFGMDSTGLDAEMTKETAFAEFRESMLAQISGGKLISEKKTTLFGKTCFEFVVNMGKDDNPEALNIMYSKNIIAGGKMYTVSFFELNGKPRSEERNKFLSSFKLGY